MSLLDAEARLAYALEAKSPIRPWDEVPEWARDVWRSYVDGATPFQLATVAWASTLEELRARSQAGSR